MKNILITICARGGSKGIPGKNIKELNGIPLIHYTFEIAKKFSDLYSCDIQVSTDSVDILNSLVPLGYKTGYLRPSVLATDSAGKISAISDALNYAEILNSVKYDYILDLDVTSPLRTLDDLTAALIKLEANSEALNIFSVNHSSRNPYFNMVEEKENGFVKVVKESKAYKSRQEVPLVYDMNASFYFYKRKFFDAGYEISITPFSLVYVMDHICFDLDHSHDFTIMEIMLKNKLIQFEI